jgi:ABC-type dipeptide/oligopeptide/nickel transport system ATPase component
MSVRFISHDMGVVAEIADEVPVMYRGKVMERGPVEQIFHAPQDEYTRRLIGCLSTMHWRDLRIRVRLSPKSLMDPGYQACSPGHVCLIGVAESADHEPFLLADPE